MTRDKSVAPSVEPARRPGDKRVAAQLLGTGANRAEVRIEVLVPESSLMYMHPAEESMHLLRRAYEEVVKALEAMATEALEEKP